MIQKVVDHLIYNVIPSAADYEAAEMLLSQTDNLEFVAWETGARLAKRRAAELAIAIDGLTDRCSIELNIIKTLVRSGVASFCAERPESIARVRGVANAYKHTILNDPTLPINSEDDVLVVPLGFGLDGYGVGKFDGEEVIVHDKYGESWKFRGDARAAIAGWFLYLSSKNAKLSSGPYYVLGTQVYP